MSAEPIPLFLDCDPGVDDAIALGYLLCQHDVKVIGLGASGGNVATAQVAANALSWLGLAGRPDIPVHAGAELPIARKPEDGEPDYADDTHGPRGTGHAQLPAPAQAPASSSAAQAWVQAGRSHPGELIGVVTGPCTNLALALRAEPELPQMIKRLFIMGGAFNYRGNTKPTTEWNTDFDPEAAQTVFTAFGGAANLPVIAPLEATEAVVMTPQRLDRIRNGAHTPQWTSWLDHMGQALRFYFEFHQADGHGYLAQIHDPFVLALAVDWARTASSDPAAPLRWSHTATAAIDVELTGTLTRGETVADWLGRWARPANAELIRRIDADSFTHHLEETLRRGPSHVPDR